MRKLFFICLSFFVVGCGMSPDLQPIEKYRGFVYAGREEVVSCDDDVRIYLKSKDSVFVVNVLIEDSKSLKYGDTIK